MLIDMNTTCELLSKQDNILILAHRKPDGDTLGASFALLRALEGLGKTARVECSDPFPARFSFIYGEEYNPPAFEPAYIVSVDVAGTSLLGQLEAKYKNKIDLCIDHHKSNELYAAHTLLDVQAPAASQIVYDVITGLGAAVTKSIADAIFTGLTTDTGCFRFANVTSRSHQVAAEVIALGADHAYINKLMFETKSKGRIEADKFALETLVYHFGGRCALIYLPTDISERCGISEDELDGISALPRTIEGVMAGVTIRDKGNGDFRVSLRTQSPLDACAICMEFGGGGHANAAGCTLHGELADVTDKILGAVGRGLERENA